MDLLRPTASPVFWRTVLFKITSAPQRLEKEIFLIQVSVSLLMSLFQTLQASCSRLQLIGNVPLPRDYCASFVLISQRNRASYMKYIMLLRELPSVEPGGSLAVPLQPQGLSLPGARPLPSGGSRELWGPRSTPRTPTQPDKLSPPAWPRAPRTEPQTSASC